MSKFRVDFIMLLSIFITFQHNFIFQCLPLHVSLLFIPPSLQYSSVQEPRLHSSELHELHWTSSLSINKLSRAGDDAMMLLLQYKLLLLPRGVS